MCRERTYDSSSRADFMELEAPYYNAIETTEVVFEKEKIIAYADSLGHIEFFDMEKNSLGYVDVPVAKDLSEKGHQAQYGDVHCGVEDNKIVFRLPVYGFDDSYPNCDGESDRWSRYAARWFRVEFDRETRQIEIVE